VRAWTIHAGDTAPQAAGVIHTDFERGFIRAEIVKYDDLMRVGSMTAAKEEGLIRSEGKEYVMQDGDQCVSAVGAGAHPHRAVSNSAISTGPAARAQRPVRRRQRVPASPS